MTKQVGVFFIKSFAWVISQACKGNMLMLTTSTKRKMHITLSQPCFRNRLDFLLVFSKKPVSLGIKEGE